MHVSSFVRPFGVSFYQGASKLYISKIYI